jgi:hypothetical protein
MPALREAICRARRSLWQGGYMTLLALRRVSLFVSVLVTPNRVDYLL